MKKFIRKIAKFLFDISKEPFIQGNFVYQKPTNCCQIAKTDQYLFLTMPDGTIIPGQKTMLIRNNMLTDRGFAEITISVIVPLTDIEKIELLDL